MNEQKNNGRGVFYGVIGVATLVVAIIGATFAYFTATQSAGNNVIGGNMATISFGVKVEKVVDPGQTSGMIPMSNHMVEAAVNNEDNEVCEDDNGNAVCQIYRITVTNTSTATMFVDGYVALAGGSGEPKDYEYTDEGIVREPTMRWAQVFKGDGLAEGTSKTNAASTEDYSTAGVQKLGTTATEVQEYTQIGNEQDTNGFNTTNIKTDSITAATTISGTSYSTVDMNFIRVSDHAQVAGATDADIPTPATSFSRTDVTSTLVLSQQLQPSGSTGAEVEYYIVVWLSETGFTQNATPVNEEGKPVNNLATSADNFFNGVVSFNSAQGSEVTATFSGYTAVASDKKETN